MCVYVWVWVWVCVSMDWWIWMDAVAHHAVDASMYDIACSTVAKGIRSILSKGAQGPWVGASSAASGAVLAQPWRKSIRTAILRAPLMQAHLPTYLNACIHTPIDNIIIYYVYVYVHASIYYTYIRTCIARPAAGRLPPMVVPLQKSTHTSTHPYTHT